MVFLCSRFKCHLHVFISTNHFGNSAVDPGWCKTDMGGAGATSSKEEGVDTSAWLASLSEEAGLKLTGKVYNRRKELLWKTV